MLALGKAVEGRMFDRRIFSDNVFGGRPHGGGFYPFLLFILDMGIWEENEARRPRALTHLGSNVTVTFGSEATGQVLLIVADQNSFSVTSMHSATFVYST